MRKIAKHMVLHNRAELASIDPNDVNVTLSFLRVFSARYRLGPLYWPVTMNRLVTSRHHDDLFPSAVRVGIRAGEHLVQHPAELVRGLIIGIERATQKMKSREASEL